MNKLILTSATAAIALLSAPLAAQVAPSPSPSPSPAHSSQGARAATQGDTLAFPPPPTADAMRPNERVDMVNQGLSPPEPEGAVPNPQDTGGLDAEAGTRGGAGAGQAGGSGSGGLPAQPRPAGSGNASGGLPGQTQGAGSDSGSGGLPAQPRPAAGSGDATGGIGAQPRGGAGGQGGQGGGGGQGSSGPIWPSPISGTITNAALQGPGGAANTATNTTLDRPVPIPQPRMPQAVLDMADSYGAVPDKFLQVISIVNSLGPSVSEAEFVARTGLSMTDVANLARTAVAISEETNSLRRKAESLKAEMAAVSRTVAGLRAALDAGASTETLVNGFGPLGLATLQAQEAHARQLLGEISNLDAAIKRNVVSSYRIAERIEGLSQLRIALQNRGLLRFASGLGEALEKIKLAPVFTTFAGIGSISTVYNAGKALGSFDPGMPGDLQLTGKYDTTLGNVTDVTLTLLSLGANALSGNVAAAGADFLTVASGRLTDTYMAYTAWQAADAEAEVAHRQYLLTLMRRNKLINAQQLAAFQARIDRLGNNIADLNAELDSRRPNPARDPDWQDPRYDPDTGLPVPSYWAYLRENSPQSLLRMGIDPEAPVGGWPGGVGPEHRPRRAGTIQPRLPTGPGYPTARPRSPRPAGADEPDGAIIDVSEDVDVEPAEERPEPDEGFVPTPRPRAPRIDLTLDITPLVFEPVTFQPVTFTGPEWQPPVWEPVTFDPPEWVPVTFDAPEPLVLDWPEFDADDPYPGSGSNLSWDYANLSGTVATDLSPWEEWLAGQNIAYLTQLALAAGYPNLAAALADARNLMNRAGNTGFRQWAYAPPVATGAIGLWASEAQHNLARAQILLGDILGQSRDIFSTAGLSDIGISGTELAYILRDFGVQDGDLIEISLEQFGRTIFTTELSLLNQGTSFEHLLRSGVARLVIRALNEGAISPNTAEIDLRNVVKGNARQSYSLLTGQQAVLRIETNAKPQTGGKPGGGQ